MPKKHFKRMFVFVVLLCLLVVIPAVLPAEALAKRGDEPWCQEECLAVHSARMRLLSEEYTKTGNLVRYQDAVKDEASRYVDCLINCKEVTPIK